MAGPSNSLALAERRPSARQNTPRGRPYHDALLAEAFLQASRYSGAEVVAVNEHLLMTTSGAAAYVSGVDQTSLWRWARVRRVAGPTLLRLDGRKPMKARCAPVVDGPALAGMLVELESPRTETTASNSTGGNRFSSVLPGTSQEASTLRAQLAHVAAGDDHVLISGETGTGRRTIARSLLDPDDIGHEIHELDATDVAGTPAAVRRLLEVPGRDRVLLIGADEWPVDLLCAVLDAAGRTGRVVATVGTPNRADVTRQLFRLQVEVPPLRERLEDLPAIAAGVLARHPCGDRVKRLDPAVRRLLWSYHWPGNITELEQVLRRAALLAPTAVIDESCVRLPAGGSGGLGARRRSMVEAAEIDTLLDALDRCGGNKLAAAHMLGISRSTLYRKVAALGVSTA